MSVEHKDWTISFPDSLVEHAIKFLKFLLSCKDDAISTTDIPAMLKEMKYERTPKKISAYQKYYSENSGGKLTLADEVSTL